MQNKIVFFGSGQYVIPIVEILKPLGLEMVITTERQGALTDYLEKSDLQYISTSLKNPKEIEHIRKINPAIGVLASYGAVIPDSVIDIFPHGILNIHPSLLPKYKGPSPIQYAIRNGDKLTGVTIIQLDNQIDHGPIVAQKEYQLHGSETFSSLTQDLFKIGADMIGNILVEFEKTNTIQSVSQNHFRQSFTEKISKDDGMINLKNIPDKDTLNNIIRAYFPWPGVWFKAKLNGSEKIIKLFPDEKIQVEGKNIMTHKDFINGYREGKVLLSKLHFL